MAYNGFRSLEKSKPPINELVELQHLITGVGAPEREGWVSIGRMRENGSFSIKQNASGTVDFRLPTHWKSLT